MHAAMMKPVRSGSRSKRLIPGLILASWVCAANGQLTVTSQPNPQQLAQSISGSGVAISNPVVTCHSQGYGEYSYSGSIMDITQGVILTSGRITDALGPNNSTGSGTWFAQNTSGDPLLDAVTGRTTRDACKLEFDIVPSGDSLRFEFTFGSEEYNEWVGSQYNDVFGFFINGPGIVGDPGAGGAKNIALIPGTSTAVTINNVNNGSNSSYYHDNTGGSQTQYDGYTVNLVARTPVQACQSYHLKLVIADATDRKYDSGVFIEKIESPIIALTTFTQSGGPDLIEGCNAGWIRFSRGTSQPTPLTLQYYLQGTATNGTDYSPIGNVDPAVAKLITIPANQAYVDRSITPLYDVLNEGSESIRCILGNPVCPGSALDTIEFNIIDSVFATCTPGGTICQGGSWPFTVTGGATYSWTPSIGLSCTTCPNPVASPSATTTYQVTVTDGSCTRIFNRTVQVSQLVLGATVTDVLCQGQSNGAINLGISGGVAPYTYAWTGPGGFTAGTQDISGLQPGTYSVTVTDAACTRTSSWNVIAPSALTVSLSPALLPFGQNVSCFGGNDGSIDATITGGTGPYSVSWTGPGGFTSSLTDINGLYAGAYAVTVSDDHGCTANAGTTLIQTAAMSASVTGITPVLCLGDGQGSATAMGSGGVPPFSYAWNSVPPQSTPTATALPAGSYTVTVTDGYGCVSSATATIPGPTAALTTNLTAQTNVLCHGASTGSATISISGGTAPYATSWNTVPVQNGVSATNLPAGTWTATVTDANGCSTTRNVTITEPAIALTATVFAQTDVLCHGNSTGAATVSASGGTGPYTYEWNTAPVQNTATATGLVGGSYGCTVRDVNNCEATVVVTIVQPAALSANIASQTNVLCSGSATGTATISVNGGAAPCSISWNTTPVQATTTATGLAAGTWTCTITDANGCTTAAQATITEPSPLAITGSVQAANCQGAADGAVDATVSGGIAPYAYSWSGPSGFTANTQDIASIIAGGYVLNVVDANGCTAAASFSVNQPGLFSVSAMVSDHNGTGVSCPSASDGSIDLTVSGATPPYNFQWTGPLGPLGTSEDVSGLASGTHVVVISDQNGCSTTQTFVLTAPAPLSASPLVTNVACAGGANGGIDMEIAGGVLPYQFNWSGPGGFSATSEDIGMLAAGSYALEVTDGNGCVALVAVPVGAPSALALSLVNVSPQTCFGTANGQATVSASGGTAPYTYSWNTVPVQTGATASGLVAGSHVATVTDANGCATSISVTVDGPSGPLALSVDTIVDVLCHGGFSGEAHVIASGGLAPYAITWNTLPMQSGPDATGLSAGTWTATVMDAYGCSSSLNVVVDQPVTPINAYVDDMQDVSCTGGSDGYATFEVTGGSGSHTMVWNTVPAQSGPTATGLPAGAYVITITDNNGCPTPAVFGVTIIEPPAPVSITATVSDHSGYAVGCSGGADGVIDVSVTGGTPGYTYAWTGPGGYTASTQDINALAAGSYQLSVTDANGCTAIHSTTLTQPNAISTTAIIATAACNGASNGGIDITVSGGAAPYTYLWTGPGGALATTEDISGVPAAVYGVTIIDANGCSSTFQHNVNEPDDLGATATLSLYPGGYGVSCASSADGAIDVNISGGVGPYTTQWSGPGGFASAVEDITGSQAGTYDLTIVDANGCSALEQFNLTAPPPLVVGLAPQVYPGGANISCAGAVDGMIDASISGGTPGYVLGWSGPNAFSSTSEDLSGLEPGTYTFTAWDINGCTTSQSVVLVAPAGLSVTAFLSQYNSGDGVSCAGAGNGIIDLSIGGGLAPYTVNWTGPSGFTSTDIDLIGVGAGTYTAVVSDAAGCDTLLSFTLTEPTPIALTGVISDHSGYALSCNGSFDGSIDLSSSGGSSPYTFTWTGPNAFVGNTEDISGLEAGQYDLIVTDLNGCKAFLTYVLFAPDPIATTSIVSTAACLGADDGAIDLTITGGISPYATQWTGPGAYGATTEDISSLYAGIYTVAITDANGCTYSASHTVTQPGDLVATAIITTHPGGYGVSCSGASDGAIDVTATGGTPPLFYFWQGPGGFTAITEDIGGVVAGSYDLTITDSNGCGQLMTWTITAPTPVNIGLNPSQFPDGSNIGCAGGANGSIDAIIAGGVAPYSIAWGGPGGALGITEDLTGLAAGTYVMDVIDALGCTASASITLVEPSPMVATASTGTYPGGGNVSCAGETDGSIDLEMTGGSLLYQITWTGPGGFASNDEDLAGLAAGTYHVSVTDANGCVASASAVLNAPSPIVVDPVISQFSGGFAIDCNGNASGSIDAVVQGGAVPWNYLWTGPSGFTSTSQDLVGVPAGVYDLLVTDAAGCTATATATLSEPTPIDMTATVSDAGNGFEVGCAGNDGSITLQVNGGAGPYIFDWSGSGGFASLDQDLSGLAAGTYGVTVVDVNGCEVQGTHVLEEAPELAATSVISGNVCDGLDDGSIDLSVSGGVLPYQITWSGPGAFSSTAEDIDGLVGGSYTADIIDANGCSAQLSAVIAASAPIGLGLYLSDYGLFNLPCFGDSSGTIEATITGGALPLDITWNGPGGFGSDAPFLSGLLAGDYALSIVDVNGCSLDTVITLTAPAAPLGATLSAALQPAGTNLSCFGGSDGSVDMTVTGGVAPYDITWHGPPAESYYTEDLAGVVAGLYDVVIADANGCTHSASITLSGPDSALATNVAVGQYAGGFNTSCDGSSDGTIAVSVAGGSGGYLIDWSGPGGYASAADSITGLGQGLYVLTVTDMNGCEAIDSIDVLAPEPLALVFDAPLYPGGSNISCNGASDGALELVVTGGAPSYVLNWSGPGGFSSVADSLAGLIAGTYCADITDANGCTAQQCITLTEPATLSVSASTTDEVCGGANGAIDMTVTGGSMPYAFAWNDGPSTEDRPGLVAGSYVVIVTDANGCASSLPVNVQGSASLAADAVVIDLVCAGSPDGAIDLTMLTGTTPYVFAWNDGSVSEDLGGLAPGDYDVTVTDANGCSWSGSFNVGDGATIMAEGFVHAYANGYNVSSAGASDGSISVSAAGGSAPYSYDWSNGATGAMITGLAPGPYSVVITDASGCNAMLAFELTGPAGIAVPTGFSPNGDGANDHYVVPGLDAFSYNHFTVFNRWGNVVYERFNYANEWNGESSEGDQLPNGTYFVILDVEHGRIVLQDFVDLRR